MRRRSLLDAARLQPVYVPLLAVVLAAVLAGLLIVAVGSNPFEAYWALLRGMFGSGDRVAASLARSTPFIGGALAVALAFRAGLFNIGVEGQILVGATTAGWVGTLGWLADLPGPLLIPLVLLAGMVGGGIWGAIPGVLKVRTGAHEVIVTIMLNSIAALAVSWMLGSTDPIVLRDPDASVPRGRPLPSAGRLPELVASVPRLHLGLVLLVLTCGLVYVVLRRTTFGFEVRTVGTNPNAARYAGMDVNRTIVVVMLLSGALAGLAGAGEVSGSTGFLDAGLFTAIGFDSIAIALLARANPVAIVLTATLWGSLLSGAGLMQQEAGLSIDAVRIFQALVLLLVAADAIVRAIFRIRRAAPADALETVHLGSGWSEGPG